MKRKAITGGLSYSKASMQCSSTSSSRSSMEEPQGFRKIVQQAWIVLIQGRWDIRGGKYIKAAFGVQSFSSAQQQQYPQGSVCLRCLWLFALARRGRKRTTGRRIPERELACTHADPNGLYIRNRRRRGAPGCTLTHSLIMETK